MTLLFSIFLVSTWRVIRIFSHANDFFTRRFDLLRCTAEKIASTFLLYFCSDFEIEFGAPETACLSLDEAALVDEVQGSG